jgi:hypothetical protein
VRAAQGLASAQARQLGEEPARRDAAHAREQRVGLGHVAHAPPDLEALAPRVEPEDGRAAREVAQEAEHALQERALAGAVRAQEARDALAELEGDVDERGRAAAVGLREVRDGDDGHAVSPSPSS